MNITVYALVAEVETDSKNPIKGVADIAYFHLSQPVIYFNKADAEENKGTSDVVRLSFTVSK